MSGVAVETDRQGTAPNGNEVTQTTFTTYDLSGLDVKIDENLTQVIDRYYDDESDPNSATNVVLNQIRAYAAEIKCSTFQGKGSIDDYAELFQAASNIANETKQMELSVDISGFNEFANAADDLSKLFTSFITRLQNVNIINDLSFLTAISSALAKIVNLSKVFGKFKETILATTTIEVPKSAHDAKLIVQGVMSELNCAMTYIGHFVDPSQAAPDAAKLSVDEKNVISGAIKAIETWNTLCEQDVTISMSNSVDILFIKGASNDLHTKASILTHNTSTLRGKLRAYNLM